MPTDGGVEYAPSKPSSESIQLQKSSSGVLENPYQDRSLETAEQRKDSIEALTSEKNLVDALSLMVDIIYNNPLFVNKLVVTDRNTLSALIRLLTKSDSVDILTEDPECNCLSQHLLKVSSIHIMKGSMTTEFKYSHQNAKRILDEHHICIKYVRI